MSEDSGLQQKTHEWFVRATGHGYSYHFDFLGLPIIQFPQDIVAIQEIIWAVQPDLIIETGIARGGSLTLSAGILALLDLADAAASGETVDPRSPKRKVLAVDIDIRKANRFAIERHPLASRIHMIEGSSIDAAIIESVKEFAKGYEKILVLLDSNHTHEHVSKELEAYAPLVTPGSYCVVFDTIIENMPEGTYPDRPWGRGNNPKTAVEEFLRLHPEFEVDGTVDAKLQISVAIGGYLRRRLTK
jgi:cephalosporin hydroxylase